MNKSLVTNGSAAIIVGVGLALAEPWRQPVLMTGMFALSGAITNWLAVHMLFEKVPGLYGSGVIPARFEEFKAGIERLIMSQFFTPENIARFFKSSDAVPQVDAGKVIDGVDFSGVFEQLVAVVKESPFGGMIGMFGGDAALEPLKAPFESRMKKVFGELAGSDSFKEALSGSIGDAMDPDALQDKVQGIVAARLNELTPQLVKEIVQDMIRAHLGWLVVWGGVFGGLIGLITSMVQHVMSAG